MTLVLLAAILSTMRPMTTILASLLLLSVMGASPALAAEPESCSLSVTPSKGPPGTQFVFSGSGYTPTQLTLKQRGTKPHAMELDLKGADPFQIPFLATEAEAGRWTVIASIPDTECAGRASINVILPDTAPVAEAPASHAPAQPIVLAAFGILGALFLASAWLLTRRFTRRA